jgi:molybdate transport system substrate-binding protein
LRVTCGAPCARRIHRNGGSDASVASQFDPTSIGARTRPRRTALLKRLFTIPAVLIALSAAPQPVAALDAITVFAAASMRNALEDVDAAFTRATGVKVIASYAASSALAKQIVQGAPADVYVSANVKWMDFLAAKNLVVPGTRTDLLGNRLVLIAPDDSKLGKVEIVQGFNIAKLAGDNRIAVADTKSVPAGLYAKAALQSLGVWAIAEPRLAQAENVRATLAYVARGETPLGIVYATDAKVEPKVKIVGTFPAGSHPAITYPVAGLAESKSKHIGRYLRFLRTQAASAIFERYGFVVLTPSKAS